jgi:superfamily II DNA or RNA helicase
VTDRIATDRLGELIVDREEFQVDFAKLERIVVDKFLLGSSADTLDAAVVGNLLRYADVLSHSTETQHRELAYNTIALLREFDELIGLPDDLQDRVLAISEAVLVQLGNFPGIRTLQKGIAGKYALPLSRGALRIAKEVLHRTHRGDAVLTDAQYAIAESMRGEDFFSFSGPTSLGKSFIIKDVLYDIVRRDELNGHCVVILVPTKALIGQTANDLRELLINVPEVHVATYPTLPLLFRQKHLRTVFVLTPERLLRYLANPVRQIDYLFVDEAQKVIAKNDARSSLYYHAIVEATRRFATKLVFASPSIQNPELFLELFGKATNGALAVRERTVAQQHFFVDLVDRKQYYFSGLDQTARQLATVPTSSDAVDLVIARSGDRKAIVYVNSSAKSSQLALRLAEALDEVADPKIDDLISYAKQYVHNEYFLAKTLKHGVAYHHGKMPQEVREKVEKAFADSESPLRFIVCTSTLLEGVNLPAKNIYILSDKHGSRNFSKIDFENLVGRAGRLTYDFSGNVICVREEENRWSQSTQTLIARSEPEVAKSFLVQPGARRKEYTDIAHVLRGHELPGSPSADERRSVQQYASILLLHQIDQQQTPLRSNFLDKVGDGRDLLRKATASIRVSPEVLRRAPNILPEYQNAVWTLLTSGEAAALVPADADLTQVDTFHGILRRLSALYDWPSVEARGTDPLIPPNSSDEGKDRRLRYWAILMNNWVRGDPLSRVVANSISYYNNVGSITYRDYSRAESLVTERFDSDSAKHINLVIEWTLRDIEGGLRFRIIAYLENFYDISVLVLGRSHAGINVATLVEYGTTDSRAIELQEIGFSRSVAAELLVEHNDCLRFTESGEVGEIDHLTLLSRTELSNDAQDEIARILIKASVPVLAAASE